MDWPKLIEKFTLPLGIILTISIFMGAYFLIKYTNDQPKTANTEEKIVVDVSGAIQTPGVYTFNTGQIIEDAIKQAGGLTDQADLELLAKTINRAALLQNHGKVYIPAKGDTSYSLLNSGSASSSSSSSQTSGPININTASAAELDQLPGIGPVISGRIIDYRQKNNGFKRKEDLLKVSGIGSALYAKIKNLVTI